MGWNPKYALLILTSTVITYLCGLGIDMFSAEKKRVRKAVLLAEFCPIWDFGFL